MKKFHSIFIDSVVILALSLSFAPSGAVAQDAGTTQSPPPPFPPQSLPLPSSVSPVTSVETAPAPSQVEPQRMPPPPHGQNGQMHQNGDSKGMNVPQKSKSIPKQKESMEFEKGDFEEDDFDQEEYVNPQEIKDSLRQLRDIKKQAQSTLKRAKKNSNFTKEIDELNALISEVARLSDAIQNASNGSEQRETLQEFYDAQLWDMFNSIRIKIEFPQELKNIEKDLKRVEKLLSSKKFSIEGVDINVVRAKIEEIRRAVDEARNQFNNGNFEDAREELSVIYESSHPGEIFGVLNQLREIDKRFKSLKSEVKSVFRETLGPVFEAINEGDFREANMMLNEIQRELWKLFDKAKGRSSRLNEDVRQKLQNLERQLENKQQQIEKQKSSSGGEQSMKYEQYKPYKASVGETLTNLFK